MDKIKYFNVPKAIDKHQDLTNLSKKTNVITFQFIEYSKLLGTYVISKVMS